MASQDQVLEKLKDQSNYLVVTESKECFLDDDENRVKVDYSIFENLLSQSKIKMLANVGEETMYIIVPDA